MQNWKEEKCSRILLASLIFSILDLTYCRVEKEFGLTGCSAAHPIPCPAGCYACYAVHAEGMT